MGDKTIREMKTAMQELFSKLEIEHPNLFNTNTLEGRKFINDYYKFFEMEKQQSHLYAEFAIRCDRMDMKILNFEDFVKLETFKKEQGL